MRAVLLVLSMALLLPACARRFRVDGMVLQVEPHRGALLVSHRAIPGVMPAMVMLVRVEKASELLGVRAGSRVHFELRIERGAAVARNLRNAQIVLDGAGSDLTLPEPPQKVQPGGSVPDFVLTDQLGEMVRFSSMRGRIVIVNFLYTRCPLPEVCPRLAASFARVQRRFSDRMGSELVLLSITLDPRHDQPAVLAEYARKWRASPAAWKFLTGSEVDVEAVASALGVIYWPEEGLITHTSSTALVGRDGRLLATVDGSSFEADQLGDLVAQYLEAE